MTNRIAAAAAAWLLALAAHAAAQTDVIKLRAGGEAKGKITQLTSKNVVYVDAKGATATVKNEDVIDVVLGDTPPSLKAANAAAAGKNWDKAVNLYETAMGEIPKGREHLHKQYVLFGWAVALDGK